MVLNYIWIAFFVIAFIVALVRLIFWGDLEVFPAIINSTFDSSKTAFDISLGLTGILSLWLGIMKIGEQGGVINLFSRILGPLFSKLFPDIPKGHPVTGSIFMNLAANMLGLDNAATPLGLKAMEGLQELNPRKDTASNPMIMFLVLNTSSLTLIPISIMVYRAQLGASQPTDVFVPILLATFFSTLAGIITVSIYQRINLLNRTILLFLGGTSLLIGGIIYFFTTLGRAQIDAYSTTFANVFLFVIIIGFILAGVRKKINVYNAFVDGAKEPHHSVPGCHFGIHRRFPRFRQYGFSDSGNLVPYRLVRNRQPVRRRPSYRTDETPERKRSPWTDGRCHEHVWSRFIRRTVGLHYPRLHRYYILYTGRLFRQCGNHQNPPCRSLRTPVRFSRNSGSHFHLLSIL